MDDARKLAAMLLDFVLQPAPDHSVPESDNTVRLRNQIGPCQRVETAEDGNTVDGFTLCLGIVEESYDLHPEVGANVMNVSPLVAGSQYDQFAWLLRS